MNTRPTRAPAPPQQQATMTIEHEPHSPDHTMEFSEPREQPAPQLPAERRTNGNGHLPQGEQRARVELPHTGFAKVAAGIAAVMAEIKPVEKAGWNDFQKYTYARIGDLNIELTPLMGKHGIVVFQNEVDRSMFDDGKVVAVRYEFTVVHTSGEIWPERPLITGMARCRDSKGGFDDKTFNKAHTAARKYFLISLFQIPVDDVADGDEGSDDGVGGTGQAHARPRPQGQARRPVPAPNGKVGPHAIAIIDGENATDWGARFKGFIAKAETAEEIDKWYAVNQSTFENIKRKGWSDLYNELIDAMDERAAALAKPAEPEKPERTGPTDTHTSSGTPRAPREIAKPVTLSADELDIPVSLDAKLTDAEKKWLNGLADEYAACTEAAEMASVQQSVMFPSQESVSAHAWARAVGLTQQHLKRVQG